MVDFRDFTLRAGEAARDRELARDRGGGIAIPSNDTDKLIISFQFSRKLIDKRTHHASLASFP